MRKILFLAFITFTLSGKFSFAELPILVPGEDFVKNELLIKFKKEVVEKRIEEIFNEFSLKEVGYVKSINLYHVKILDSTSVQELIKKLSLLTEIDYAEPNYIRHMSAAPNDPDYPKQWGLKNTGQTVTGKNGVAVEGTPGADIDIERAWAFNSGVEKEVVVAVIDSGIDMIHPEILPKLWVNQKDKTVDYKDDDENGYIDDGMGWNFVDNNNFVIDLGGTGAHGTHIAGVIAAVEGNKIGMVGVTQKVKILSLKVLGKDGASEANILSAIDYAIKMKVKIINFSIGGARYNKAELDIIEEANKAGVLLIVAAGNKSNNNDNKGDYPASYDSENIISVAASNQKDELASFSNYGLKTVDVAAPGENIYSTAPMFSNMETFFEDDFESGGAKWITDGSKEAWGIKDISPNIHKNAASDSKDYYLNSNDSYIQIATPLDFSNVTNGIIEFDLMYDLEYLYDFLYLEYSLDGEKWSTKYFFTGLSSYYFLNFYTPIRIDISNLANTQKVYLRFRFHSDNINKANYGGVYIDNVKIIGRLNTHSSEDYVFMNGTSMAAPFVSGVAALIKSKFPTLTHLQIKDAILSSVDKLPSLQGKVLTGGRINAYKALLKAQEILKNDDDDDKVTNDIDKCPDTQPNTNVNSVGCPVPIISDSDNDKVMDNIDTCPNTPSTEQVDSTGCSPSQIDTDGDKIMDNIDTQINTLNGCMVDRKGVAIDSDSDTVCDGLDDCPDTPNGAVVDADGCALSQFDTDGDKIMDNIDKCPNTPNGVIVDANGCNVLNNVEAGPAPTIGQYGILILCFLIVAVAKRRNNTWVQ